MEHLAPALEHLAPAFVFLAIGAVWIAHFYYRNKRHYANVELVQQTLARGEALTPELLDRLFPKDAPKKKTDMPPYVVARTVGIVLIFAGIGLAIFGWILGSANFQDGTDLAKAAAARFAIGGTGALVGCIGIGVLVASWFIQKTTNSDSRP
jgi:protein-S-isoprenylcysteine O-methyltransferase Ste14